MKPKLSTFQIAATYIGTVVGAGFASGQEVLQFFGFFGSDGIAGIGLATALLVFFGWRILAVAHRERASSYVEVVHEVGGARLGQAIDWVITFFLLGALTTMIAGAGAVFMEEFGLRAWIGGGTMAIVTLATVLLGFGGVIQAISIVVPMLLAAVFGVGAYLLIFAPANLAFSAPVRAPIPWWPVAAVAYASYNLVLAIAVLVPLGGLSDGERLRKGAIWGGVGLGAGALAIHLAILTQAPGIGQVEVPMIWAAGRISPVIRALYSIVLLAEVYTTAVGGLYGFTTRVVREGDRRYAPAAVLVSGVAFILSQVGFSTLVGIVYSVVGYAGFALLGALALDALKEATEAESAV